MFQVNWFRCNDDGKFLWPGSGESLRVIEWALVRLDESVPATQTPIGLVPTSESLNLAGLNMTAEQIGATLDVDDIAWAEEATQIDAWFDKSGASLPSLLADDLMPGKPGSRDEGADCGPTVRTSSSPVRSDGRDHIGRRLGRPRARTT
jgi:GTP-dependent phosphoenolpyruvate carboxykinase